MYIYKITNKINGKSYIGQTNDFSRRIREHCSRNYMLIDENKKKHKPDHSGENNGRAKLTKQDVLKIRELYAQNVSNQTIYELFPQVTPTSIRAVINGITWKNI